MITHWPTNNRSYFEKCFCLFPLFRMITACFFFCYVFVFVFGCNCEVRKPLQPATWTKRVRPGSCTSARGSGRVGVSRSDGPGFRGRLITMTMHYSPPARIWKTNTRLILEVGENQRYIDRVPYFLYLLNTTSSLKLQIWLLFSTLDTLSPFWSHI